MGYATIGFYGLGLIGGSIAKAVKETANTTRIIATSGHLSTVEEAYRAGVIENKELLPASAFSECDLILLCAPVSRNISFLKELKPFLREGCIVTDVGSVKGAVHEEAVRLSLSHCFIGGHPMTGSEKTGFSNGSAFLLENAYYLITPEEHVPAEKVEEFTEFVRSLRAIPLLLDEKTHDRATAAVSHLPHVIAASLVNLVRESDNKDEILKTIAAGGFRDITRIASGSPVMWESICLENREQILALIDRFSEELSGIRQRIEESDAEGIRSFFSEAKNYRDSFNLKKVSRPIVYELFSDLVDTEGAIASVTTILAAEHINIRNIGILHNREYEQGVLHIEFYNEASFLRAQEVLKGKGYTIYLR